MKGRHDSETAKGSRDYLRQVRRYWDEANAAYLQHVASTFQAGLVRTGSAEPTARASNLYLASRAGIRPGHRVLDAGCGVCGPSIDIAGNLKTIALHCITLSGVQAEQGGRMVREAGLSDRISVQQADFHDLPFAGRIFDVVIFFESSGYSYDLPKLFCEVHRVLRPNGTVYIKDVFAKEHCLSRQERRELADFDRLFSSRTRPISQYEAAISAAGFCGIQSCDLTDRMSTNHALRAMFDFTNRRLQLTTFGELHFRFYESLPTFFGEIRAKKAP